MLACGEGPLGQLTSVEDREGRLNENEAENSREKETHLGWSQFMKVEAIVRGVGHTAIIELEGIVVRGSRHPASCVEHGDNGSK
jgi:hypothetical protein